nr:unnamed protein product [Digitaria exilis]
MATAPLALRLPLPFPSASRPPPPRTLAPPAPRRLPTRLAAAPARRFRPPTADDEPPEAAEDSSHGLNRYDQLARSVERARSRQPEITPDHPLFSSPPSADGAGGGSYDPDDEFFDEIDRAIAEKREEFTRRGLIKPSPASPASSQSPPEEEGLADELSPEEVIDLDEIRKLQGLSVVSLADEEDEEAERGEDEDGDYGLSLEEDGESFDAAGELGIEGARIRQPAFRMTLAELLDESKLVPVAVTGDQDVALAGVQHDASLVAAGDLFVCVGEEGLAGLTEADKRGAVAVVADQDVNIEGTLACRALVIVDDIVAALRVLPACLYRRPSTEMAVIGVTGTDGVTTTTHLVKAMYEAMGVRTGMVGVLGAYAFGSNKVDARADASDDPIAVQKLMATMLHNGAEAVVLETASDGMPPSGVDSEIDYDIAVLTNVRHTDGEDGMTYEEYMSSMASLFSRMVDPERHRKVVNIDDPSAPFFAAQGGHDVPVVTYSFDNKKADVHTLKYQLSLFETEVLVQTPHGILEISSGLLGRDNIYNILATVAVGIAVGAPLEDIVRGIEEVDAIPGRCELIDEEQAFGVIVDHARTPEALSRLLDGVRELGPRRIVTVVGCCGEKERGKRPVMTKIAVDKSDVVMLTSDNPANEDPCWTMEEYLKYGANDYYPPLPNGHRLFLHDIRRVAVRAAVAMGEQGDVVVITGKGNDTYQIEGDKNEFFDDREECREALQYTRGLLNQGFMANSAMKMAATTEKVFVALPAEFKAGQTTLSWVLGHFSSSGATVVITHVHVPPQTIPDDAPSELGLYDELKEACIAAENLMKRALNESSRRQKADEEVVSALQKANEYQELYLEEVRKREELEEALARANWEIAQLRQANHLPMDEQSTSLDGLQEAMSEKLSFERHMVDMDAVLGTASQDIEPQKDYVQIQIDLDTGARELQALLSQSKLTAFSPSSVIQSPYDEDCIPSYFLCPILQEPMRDPHVAADGFTYEADAIRGWLDGGNDASPVTGQPLAHLELAPNLALGAVIQDYTIRRRQHKFS